MRHQKKKIILDRKKAPRQALLVNLSESLILYEKITTTKAKAKATKSRVEKLITMAKKDDLAARRRVMKSMHTKGAMRKLFEQIAPKYKDRKGGFTRITTLKNRQGDGAEVAMIELV